MSEADTRDQDAAAAPSEGEASTRDSGAGDVAFAEPDVEAEPPNVESKPDALEVAKAEAQKYRDQLLRTAADFDNFRKRSRREIEDAQRKGKEQTLKDLLPVFDNLERAVTSAEGAPDAKSVADGLKMIIRQFTNTLDRMNIKRVPTVGEPFDPMRHEAIQHAHSTEHAPGVVTAEVQAGYMLGDYLLRAAMVVVSKGPAEAPEGGTGEQPASGDPEPN
jgi:molecular chaperone GrpE